MTQQLDLTGTVGKMIASVLLGIAEMGLEHVRQRKAIGNNVTEACAKRGNGSKKRRYRH